MNKQQPTQAIASHVFVFTLAAIFFTGSIGVGTVWLRHQISVTAKANKDCEARLASLERSLAETAALRAAEENPASLDLRNRTPGLTLVIPTESQVQRVEGDPVLRLSTKRNRELFNNGVKPITLPRFAQN